jgi:hypothetical protein
VHAEGTAAGRPVSGRGYVELVDQRLVWLLSPELTPGTRGYFEASILGPAVSYRVSVYSFDWKRGA